jgi:citrate synthase
MMDAVSKAKAAVEEWVTADEASKLATIKKPTLYAYVSRGLIRSVEGGGLSRARLYNREDVEHVRTRSRARSGHAAVAASALRWGEPVLDTRIGTIDARGPIYRGIPARELVDNGATFEETCEILWESPFVANVPKKETSLETARSLLPKRALPFDAMFVMASILAAAEGRGDALLMMKTRAGTLIRRLVAACAFPRGAKVVERALAAKSVAESLLVGLGGKTDARAVSAMNRALVLCADHELNASTFAVRIAASADASLPASLLAGLAAMSGTLHGGATARVEAFVDEVGAPEKAATAVASRRDRGEAVPGFGHKLYPEGDPRGAVLLGDAQKLAPRVRDVKVLVAAANAMNLAARELPTVDVGTVALSSALGLPRGSALAIFACGRLAGWVAHALEQRQDGHLLRPRARYVGPSSTVAASE